MIISYFCDKIKSFAIDCINPSKKEAESVAENRLQFG